MRRSTPWLLGMAGLCLTAGLWILNVVSPPGAEAQERNEEAVKAFMRGKLDAAQRVLEGLVEEDYVLIRKGADRMHVMSTKARWNVVQGPEYARQSAAFRHALKRLSKMAEKKNVDGAALAYMQVTLQCIDCHKSLRGRKVVEVPVPRVPQTGFASAAVNR